ncbi:MAG: hypothetical protein CM15mP103_03530 [Gammaproteobacteria bacterium]|nr:MAG: hypothetical protein CM15mP103_03530 [Gammaproteobacteria bacterium]
MAAYSGRSPFLLCWGGLTSPTWSLEANVFLLGTANGGFAVAAIGAMMVLASAGQQKREGIRMGLWGAAQAIAFALGAFLARWRSTSPATGSMIRPFPMAWFSPVRAFCSWSPHR